mmetsp:Transcript_141630/g.440289  ORF Transcript_141630/g.440289 Transcript_141630/m.440289 type:complete len:329 (+) Transcript_141630:78-1064(+)|eukprot:CAMPEP_0204526208 /NCGR_PEP_ID=MMETSP0661-20131031/8317_1 /ASSEMBLY_ACC=CAM_ASM_000606 /TAXON_ID=109239 /ORGANISM="Alexandrium margalefi, Strain AMGDE01CS-322" /LENGTH=328 /DNA_ID=CAMNT_0051532041 /DNA_START=69 /DNA_END=1055 /DNA_ORIENTATION=+
MAPFQSLLVIAAVFPCWALKQELPDQVSLLQAELEKAKTPKASTPELVEPEDELSEPICQQLAGKDGSCERLVPESVDLLRAAPQEKAAAKVQASPVEQPQTQQPAVKAAKSTGSSVLGYFLDVLVVALALDGLRRWHRAKAEQATEAEGWDGLMQAALAGDAARCEKLISKGVGVAGADLWGCTVLHAASKGGSVPAVCKLLACGAKVDEPDSWDDTPLHLAARAGHSSICEQLLEHGAPIDAKNAQEWTPLVVAADAGHEATCRLLLGRGASTSSLEGEAVPKLLVSLLAEAEAERREADEEEEADFARRAEEEYWLREQAAEGTN